MRVPLYVVRAVQAASKSWPETARLCVLLLFLAAAGALFLTMFVVVVPALYGNAVPPALR